MSAGTQYYIITLLVYAGVSIIACWGLDLEYGQAGILNFGFVVFQAAGAYTAALLTLGSSGSNQYEHYIAGTHWPFPLPIVGAAVVGAILSIPVGFVALRRLRADYQAISMLVLSLIATTVAVNDNGLVNGSRGLFLIPQPLQSTLSSFTPLAYQWFYVGLLGVFVLISLWVMNRISRAPLGRTLRAVRDSESAAAALGKNVLGLRMGAFVVGNMLAAVSGALLVLFIGAWSPNGWLYPETFVYFGALIIGGAGNRLGVFLGALVLPVGISEGVRYLPQFGRPGLVDAIEFGLIGVLIITFMWFRPNGILPERRRKYRSTGGPVPQLGIPPHANPTTGLVPAAGRETSRG
jgi:branched-chain amino acid transport system permease protein